MTIKQLMRQIIAQQDELTTLLEQASIRGWTNIMQKHKMIFYDEIADLRQQLEQAESETEIALYLSQHLEWI